MKCYKFAVRAGVALQAVVAVSFSQVAVAQVSGTLPSREQIELPQAAPAETAPGVSVVSQQAAAASCPFGQSDLTAQIDAVTFTDASGAALPAQLAGILAAIEPAEGVQPIAQLCRLRDEAANRLLAAGYVAAVTIPEQEITRESRTARLAVIPARIVAIETVGDAGPQAARIAARAERLKALYPLRTADLERELLLASDNPGLDVKMTLASANAGPGQVVGRLEVVQRAFQVVANVQNLGSRQVGREIGSVRAEFYGLTGLADVTFIGGSATADFEEQWTVQGGHYMTFDSGLTFGGSLAYAESRPDLALDIRSKSLLGAIEAYAPIARTVATRATLGGGLEFVEQESKLYAPGLALPLTRDKLRVAFLKLQGAHRFVSTNGIETGSLDGALQLRKGLDIFDASERGTAEGLFFPSNLEGDPTAFVVRGGYSARLRSGTFLLLGRLDGQVSDDPLLSFEEYSVGNYTLGRGYDPSVTSGDSAIGGRIQPSFVMDAGDATLEPYGFVDAVRIWNKDTVTTEDGRSLVSAGLGARVYFADRFMIDAGWAHPFDKPVAVAGVPRAPDRFLVSLTASLGPTAR